MRKTHLAASALALCATLALSATAASAAAVTERATTYQLDTGAGLANTTTNYDNVFTLPAGGDSLNVSLGVKTGATGFSYSYTGGVTGTMAVPNPGDTSAGGQILNNGAGGTFGFNYSTANGPDLNASFTDSEVLGGHDVLHFSGGGFGLLDTGGIFSLNIFITGDWSALGTSAGDHTGLTFDPGYNLINDFTYDAGLNETLLTLSTGDYTGANPSVDFYLVGGRHVGADGVPEPAAWALMLLGFGGMGAALRARRRAPASAPA